jgi:hypothetical protein
MFQMKQIRKIPVCLPVADAFAGPANRPKNPIALLGGSVKKAGIGRNNRQTARIWPPGGAIPRGSMPTVQV